MSVWTTGTSGLETVLATLGNSVNSKGSHGNSVVSTQPGSNLLSNSTHLGHHTYVNPTAPQFVYKPSAGLGYQQKVIFFIFIFAHTFDVRSIYRHEIVIFFFHFLA